MQVSGLRQGPAGGVDVDGPRESSVSAGMAPLSKDSEVQEVSYPGKDSLHLTSPIVNLRAYENIKLEKSTWCAIQGSGKEWAVSRWRLAGGGWDE